ncbi:hypothetical protein BAUR9175_02969 [Brevibacterium aurantiacum]|uniref:Uncharacterized protein n=1 Tax=Brevibacterium aurantiacum TaxID=273384 RepID=A0A2H1K0U2_BREAU|nr:hypothetical protein BAUR9175_02969 [Brevibacterium aurantiacum]
MNAVGRTCESDSDALPFSGIERLRWTISTTVCTCAVASGLVPNGDLQIIRDFNIFGVTTHDADLMSSAYFPEPFSAE